MHVLVNAWEVGAIRVGYGALNVGSMPYLGIEDRAWRESQEDSPGWALPNARCEEAADREVVCPN